MSGLLQSHIAVVTGAGSGIGRAIAVGYAREGARVVALDVNANGAAETAKQIGGNAVSFALDVADCDACIAMAKQIADTIGPVSILLNGAGIIRRNPSRPPRTPCSRIGRTSSRSTSMARST